MKDEMKKTSQTGTAAAAARSAAESKVGLEAVARSGGRNPQLKGVVHEVLYKDMYNMDPKRLADGTKAVLSKSSTAVRDDVLIKDGAKIVKRLQLKDTPASVSDVVAKVRDGHYAGTNLCGTVETTAAYEQRAANALKPVTQKMTSTGISSDDTARIAIQTLGEGAGKLTPKMVGKVAAGSGAAGAAISGGLEVLTSGKELLDGEIDGGEFVGKVACAAGSGALSAAGGSAAATLASAGTASLLAGTGLLAGTTAALWVPAAVGVGAAVAVGSFISEGISALVDDIFCW